MKHFSNIDLRKSQISNVVIDVQTSASASNLTLKDGLFFYNKDTKHLYYSDGTQSFKVGERLKVTDLVQPTSNVMFGNVILKYVADPVDDQDVATKKYVEDIAFGNANVSTITFKTVAFEDSSNLTATTSNDVLYFKTDGSIRFESNVTEKSVVLSTDLANTKIDTFSNVDFVSNDYTYERNLDVLDHVIRLLAGDKPTTMSNSNVTINSTYFSGKIPSGLDSKWYSNANSGDTVSVVYNPAIRISSNFYTGIDGLDYSYGYVRLREFGGLKSNISTALNSIGTFSTANSTGNVTVSNVTVLNKVWRNGLVSSNVNLLNEGQYEFNFDSSVSGTSPNVKIFYDDSSTTLNYSVLPSLSITSPTLKYLSNIGYYTTGTTANVSFTANTGIFNKAYHPTAVAQVYGTEGSFLTANLNPSGTPVFNATFPTFSVVTLNQANKSDNTTNAAIYVKIQRPNGTANIRTLSWGKGINTYGNVSTNTEEFFLDEAYRLVVNTNNAWSSTTSFSSSNIGVDAQVRNGFLQYPNSADYGSPYTPTGDKEYNRFFYTTDPISSGKLEFDNIDPTTEISSYGSGSLNMLVQVGSIYFDLGKDFENSSSGNSRSNSIGSKVSATSNSLTFSLGLYSTGLDSNKYKLIVIFKDTSKKIKRIKHNNI